MSEQAKALELAALLDKYDGYYALSDWVTSESADELRRLHSVNAELLEALQGLVQRCEFDGIPNDSLPAVEAARSARARALSQSKGE